MIVGNELKFGYGDICVGSSAFFMELRFQQFKPPAECGGPIPEEVEFIGDKIIMKISYEDYRELKNNLKKVSTKEISSFTFKDYIFDFSNFNEESVKVCELHLDNAMREYFRLSAC